MRHSEKMRISQARSVGPKLIQWLEHAGYESLEEFAGETPENISFRVEIATGIRHNGNALKAYENLIDFARNSTRTSEPDG